ncbi:rRNA-processing protein FCF1 homolog [Glycine soja]|uniref:rRNA-processing protein FCF1 homolog n=1 Tax=Glycine soja TaxID=3848 RepID=UPI00103F0D5F|nr:rRNA-processing protein FCF1 homolog [Glycine soja]
MGKAKKGPKFAVMKKVVTSKAIKKSVFSSLYISLCSKGKVIQKHSKSFLGPFFQYNTALGPPYRILVDTNFINFSIQNKVSSAAYFIVLFFVQLIYKNILLQHKCYIVATCDRDLKRRIRKIPGVPIMYITKHKYSIERLPEATIGGAPRI